MIDLAEEINLTPVSRADVAATFSNGHDVESVKDTIRSTVAFIFIGMIGKKLR